MKKRPTKSFHDAAPLAEIKRSPLEEQSLRQLIILCVRCRGVMEIAVDRIENIGSEFDTQGSETYIALVFLKARNFFLGHGELIPKAILIAQLRQVLSDNLTLRRRVKVTQLWEFTKEIYDFPEESLSVQEGLSLLQRFLDERVLVPVAQEAVGILSISEFHGKFDQEYRRTRVTTADHVTPLAPDAAFVVSPPRERTGVDFLDELLGGGTTPGDAIGLLGPSGGGKTMLTLQTCASVAATGRPACYLSYEQPVHGDITERVFSCAGGIERAKLSGRTQDELDDETLQAIQTAKDRIGSKLTLVDLSGAGSAGRGGVPEVAAELQRVADKHGKPPGLVAIDWFLPMAQRYMFARDLRTEELRHVCLELIDELKQLAVGANTAILVVNQLTAALSARAPQKRPHFSESAEFRSFAWLLPICLALGTLDERSNCCHLTASKVRSAAKGDVIVRLNAPLSRFELAEDMVPSQRGGFLKKSELGTGPDPGALDDLGDASWV